LPPLRNPGIVAALIATVAFVLGGESAASSTPAPEELAPNIVAFVSHVPAAVGRITDAEFQRALVQAAAAAGRGSAPKPGGNGYGRLRDEAVQELLDFVWIKGQATEMGIAVTRDQVAIELAAIKKANFKNEAQYRAFLEEAHFTRRDVDERVELQLLSARIQERIARGTTVRDVQEKFKKFVDAYMKRWRARTVCATGFATERCSNGPRPS
jgi:parvulin-like peptidyl-prolyl isomerase